MKLLLDTHIWIWSLMESKHLSKNVFRALKSSRNEMWLSPISSWEFLLLAKRGRVTLNVEPEVWLVEAWKKLPLREAFLTHEIAVESQNIDLAHNDPADKFLAATARVLDLSLVTADRRMMKSRSFAVLAND